MKRPLLISFAVALLLLARTGLADTPPKLEPIPEPGPAVIGADADMEPEITIRNRGKEKVEEYRMHGKLYMIKITPRIGRPYYLIDNEGQGRFIRRDGMDRGLVVPTWILKTW